jgi:hypothetical protein
MHVPSKTGRHCRDRFQHCLSPTPTQVAAEDDLVKRIFGESGPDWAHIAVYFAAISRGLQENRKPVQ